METLYGTKNAVDAFGYYSTESNRIWMKIWSTVSTLLEGRVALADFERNPRSSDSLRVSRNFIFLPGK